MIEPTDVRVLEFPLRGTWKVARAPEYSGCGLDLVAIRGDRDRVGVAAWWRLVLGTASVVDSYAWSASVHAPMTGQVVAASDDCPDNVRLAPAIGVARRFARALVSSPRAGRDRRVLAGNHIILASAVGYVLLAHLRSGSIRVRQGEEIGAGDYVADVGNSGNSVTPRLYLQLSDEPDPFLSRGRAFGFRRCERRSVGQWVRGDAMPLEHGWIVRNATSTPS